MMQNKGQIPVETDEKRRNLFLRLSPQRKKRLKELAKLSGMTMEVYAASILEEAIDNGELFKFVKVRLETTPTLIN